MESAQQALSWVDQHRYGDALSAFGTALALFQHRPNPRPKDGNRSHLPVGNECTTSTATRYRRQLRHTNVDRENIDSAWIISLCNAASCLRNMGTIHQIENQYEQAMQCWKQAEHFYRGAQEQLSATSPSDSTSAPGTPCQREHNPNSRSSCEASPKSVLESAATVVTAQLSQQLCIDANLIEVIQSQANLHRFYQKDLDSAIHCHDMVLQFLSVLQDLQPWQPNYSSNNSACSETASAAEIGEGVCIIPISRAQHLQFMIISLEAVGSMYRATHDDDNALEALEEAWEIGQQQFEENSEKFYADMPRLSRVLQLLAEMYRGRGDLNRSVQALYYALDLRQRSHMGEENDSKAVGIGKELVEQDVLWYELDQVGLAYETAGNLEAALACFERAVLARSQVLGNCHAGVAQSLLNVARILESQGNIEGSLDLYKAAQMIYANQLTSESLDIEQGDATAILQLIVPNLMEQGRFEEAIAFLYKCLEGDNDKSVLVEDKSCVFYELAKAHLKLQDFVSATVCLVEASKQEGSVSEERVMALLQRVEYLQRRGENHYDDDSSYDDSYTSSVTSQYSYTREGLRTLPTNKLSLEVLRELLGDDEVEQLQSQVFSTKDMNETGVSMIHGIRSEHKSQLNADKRRDLTPFTVDMSVSTGSRDDASCSATCRDVKNTVLCGGISKSCGYVAPISNISPADVLRYPFSKIDDWGTIHVGSPSVAAMVGSLPKEETILPEEVREASLLRNIKLGNKQERPLEGAVLTMDLTVPTSTANTTASREDRRPPDHMDPASIPCKNSCRGMQIRSALPSKEREKTAVHERQQRLPKIRGKSFRWKRKGVQSSPSDDALENGGLESSTEKLTSLVLDEHYHTSVDQEYVVGPVPYVSFSTRSWDDISQITTVFDRPKTPPNQRQEWRWGDSVEGFDRWFPSKYVSQAVEVAEGFLSAKAIHSKMSSCPLENEEPPSEIDEGSQSSLGGYNEESRNDTQILKTQEVKPSRMAAILEDRGDRKALPSGSKSISPICMQAGIDLGEQHLTVQNLEGRKAHPKLAETLFELALVQMSKGKTKSAIESATEALQIQKATGNTTGTAKCNQLLGKIYMGLHQYKAALSFHTEALRAKTKIYGYYSEETAKSLNCIGVVRSAQDEFSVAMKCHKEALLVLKKCHREGLKDPSVSQTLCLIGSVYYRERNSFSGTQGKKDYATFIEAGMLDAIGRAHEDLGSYKMAICFFEEKLHFLENRNIDSLNPEEEMAMTLNSLGMLNSRAGRYVEALSYYDRAFQLQKQIGCSKIQVATAMVLIGTVKFHLGCWKESLTLLNESLVVLQAEVGDEHETVAAALYQIGLVEVCFCHHEQAMSKLKRAMAIQVRLLGHEHAATLRTKREIGNLSSLNEEKLDSVFAIFSEVLEWQHKVHGSRHPNIAETLHSIGCAYARRKDHANALRQLEDCYYMRWDFLGTDHPQQATTLHEIAKIYAYRERFKKGNEICDVVIGIRRDSLSETHVDLGRALVTKGYCLNALGDTTRAMQCLNEALQLIESAVGTSHPAVAETYVQMAGVYLRLCHFQEAREKVEKALEIFRCANLDEDHLGIQEALMQLDRVERDEMLCV
jgi:tetratricopeptide (TPR) repeat protein